MKNPVLALWLALLVVSASAYSAWVVWRHQNPAEIASVRAPAANLGQALAGKLIGSLSLVERSGEPFDLGALAGRPYVVSFFFTSCPGPCFRQNQAIASVERALRDVDVSFVSITCDPQTDTPAVLRQYAQRFDTDLDRWYFLTGDLEIIKRFAREKVLMPIDTKTHSERAVVIGRDGKIRDVFNMLDDREVGELKKLLRNIAAEDKAG